MTNSLEKNEVNIVLLHILWLRQVILVVASMLFFLEYLFDEHFFWLIH